MQQQYIAQPVRSRKAIRAQLRAADNYRRNRHNPEWLRAYDQLRAEMEAAQ